MDLTIAPARLEDMATVARLFVEFERYLNTIDGGDRRPTGVANKLARYGFGEQAVCTILLARRDGAAVGYLTYSMALWGEDLRPFLYVADLFVSAPARGTGVGMALMQRARHIATDAGAGRMLWGVWDRNPSARAFYERLGATPLTDETIMVWTFDGADA